MGFGKLNAIAVLSGVCGVAGFAAGQSTSYHVTKVFPIGGEGIWDYLSIDSENRRLYASHDQQVEVIDADTGKSVGVIPHTPLVHGIAVANDLNRGFTSNGDDDSVTMFDLKALTVLKKIPVNEPNFILYEPFTHRVFPLSDKITVLDAENGEKAGDVDLGGYPEGGVSDGWGTIYVTLADKAAIAAVDAKTLKVTRVLPVKCIAPQNVAYDATNKRLLVGCVDGFRAIDADSGQLVGRSLMCGGVDSGLYDPESKLAFESCSEGVLSVIRQIGPTKYVLVQSVPTQMTAKTMAFDPKTKRIYLATADTEWVPSNDPKLPGTFHPHPKPGTFRILVVEP